MFEFVLPDLGEGIHEGEVLKWYVGVGETIAEDDPLVEIETDKAAVTIPSPRSGKLTAQNGSVGDTVNVGSVIAVIDDGSRIAVETTETVAEPAAKAAKKSEPAKKQAVQEVTPIEPGVHRPVPAAPATRRLARELGVDINRIPATGPGGRVTPEDVSAFAKGKVPAVDTPGATIPDEEPRFKEDRARAEFAAHAASAIPFLDIDPMPDFEEWGPIEKEPLRSIRRRVAHKMTTSKILIPHVAHMDEVDVTILEDFRKAEKEKRLGEPGGKLTLLPFVIKAVTAGLKNAPAFNASLDPFNEEIIYKKYYNIGIAVDSGRGLIVPVIRNTDRTSILEMSRQIEDLAVRARVGNIKVPELQGGTFTITNIGPLGGTGMIPAINYPEVAILGMGRAQEKPVVRNGEIVIRKMLPLTLAFDHRIADGADAARFVGELVRQLSDPNVLLIEG